MPGRSSWVALGIACAAAVRRGLRPASAWVCVAFALSHAAPVARAAAAATTEPGFQSLFDGRTLRGWRTPQPAWWSVEDGAITGRITRERPCGTNQYLVWAGGDLADFELKLESRVRGEGGINNGFQFRSRVLPDGDVAGYQVDNNLKTDWLARLYDEFGRHTLAWRGRSTRFDEAGQFSSAPLPEAAGPAWFALEEWHEYHLICRGPHLLLRINGRAVAESVDLDPRRADPSGVLALQLHSGPPTVVQFRNLRLKVLRGMSADPTPAPAAPWFRKVSKPAPAAAWDFGTGGHDPRQPLRYHGSLDDVEYNVRAVGPGARDGARVTQLRGGYFDAGAPLMRWGATGFTLALRAQDPAGRWHGTLIDQGVRGSGGFLRLSAEEGELRLEVETPAARTTLRHRIPSEQSRSWQSMVVRLGPDGLQLHLNGQCVAQEPRAPGPLESPAGTLRVGALVEAGAAPAHRFHGELEALAWWGEALSDERLRRLH